MTSRGESQPSSVFAKVDYFGSADTKKLSMDAQLTTAEINHFRKILKNDSPPLEALATLEKNDGILEASFHELWIEKNGSLSIMKRKSLWKITLKQMRLSICGDDSFRSKVQEYSENPGSNPLLLGLIVSVVGMAATSGLPLDSALATFIVLYVLKVGLNTFCESTESDADG